MPIKKCLDQRVKNGEISRAAADEAVALFDEAAGRGDQAAAAAQALATLERMAAAKAAARTQSLSISLDLMERSEAIRSASGHKVVREFLRAQLAPNTAGKFNDETSVHGLTGFYRSTALGLMTDFVDSFRSKAAGLVRSKAGLREAISELHGEDSGNVSAKAIAGGMREAAEYLRTQFNGILGVEAIPFRRDWGWIHRHDPGRLATATEQEYVEFTRGLLKREEMIDATTGQPMTDSDLEALLKSVRRDVISGGLDDINPNLGFARAGILKRRIEQRHLIFKNSESWLKYNDRFGNPDLFGLAIGHIESLARDIALLEKLGPYPETTVRFMETLVERAARLEAAEGGKAALAKARFRGTLTPLYNVVSGQGAVIVGGPTSRFLISTLDTLRILVAGAKLGSAFFSAFGDLVTNTSVARTFGTPAFKLIGEQLKLFAKAGLSSAERKRIARLGFVPDAWTSTAWSAQRAVGEFAGHQVARRITDTVLRTTLLSPWTEAGRSSFYLTTLARITEQVGKGFDDLPKPVAEQFRRFGISSKEWDTIRSAPLEKDGKGPGMISVMNVMKHAGEDGAAGAKEAAIKLHSMIATNSESAVIVSLPQVQEFRLKVTGSQRTLPGELAALPFLFKTFPAVFLVNNVIGRTMMRRGILNKAQHLAYLVLGMTVMGGLGTQMFQLASGKNLMSMDPTTDEGRLFWWRSIVRGGGLSFLGDIFQQSSSRFGGGLAEFIAGPVYGDLGRIIESIAAPAGEGKPEKIPAQFARAIEAMIPGQSAFFARLALRRILFDELDLMIDPGAAERFRRQEREARKRGESFFVKPGQATIGKILRGRAEIEAPRLGEAVR